jgi:hypothetical protein
MTTATELPPDARTHREAFMAYVVERAKAWHREHLGHLYRCWVRWNRDYFGEHLAPPYILLAEPSWSQALGDFSPTSCFGGMGQIRIRPVLIDGRHKYLRPGEQYAAGRRRFVEDVGLHESVHLFCGEVLGSLETSYKGHGPVFAGECNRIGDMLGLPHVRPAKCRGKNKDMPSCAQWPHNVRPPGYYLGAYIEPEPGGKARGAGQEHSETQDTFAECLQKTAAALEQLYRCMMAEAGQQPLPSWLAEQVRQLDPERLRTFHSQVQRTAERTALAITFGEPPVLALLLGAVPVSAIRDNGCNGSLNGVNGTLEHGPQLLGGPAEEPAKPAARIKRMTYDGPATIILHCTVFGSLKRDVRCFEVGDVSPYAQYTHSVTVWFKGPRKRNWDSYHVVSGNRRFITIEDRSGKLLYDSRQDVPCDMDAWHAAVAETQRRMAEQAKYGAEMPTWLPVPDAPAAPQAAPAALEDV